MITPVPMPITAEPPVAMTDCTEDQRALCVLTVLVELTEKKQ